MAINKHYKQISKDFSVYIEAEDEEWYPFNPNTKTEKFLIQRKKMKAKNTKLIDELLKSGEITIDPKLNKYANTVMFPEKVKKGRETIARIGMPKEYYEQTAKKNAEKE